jgi:capsular exopolysaccharide synthesis family protein
MEKIKSALEKARRARLTSTSLPDVKRRRHDLGSAKSNETTQNIQYTQTKIIDVNHDDLKEKGVIISSEQSIESNAYKVLRTHVLQSMRGKSWSAMGITSPAAGNGKTLTAVNLAISLSRELNQTVLLVDFDLRNPSIHQLFSLHDHPGISQYITEDIELSKILFNPGMERLVILPGKDTVGNSSEMLSSPKVVRLVEELKTYYPGRLILFDLPPILSCDDVLAFLPFLDCIMMVVEDGKTRKADLTRSLQLIDKNKLIGTILNKAEEDTTQSYY